MVTASDLRSGKTDRDENFPVAGWIIHPRHRALILAFYNFVRTADDVADHPTLADSDKLSLLDALDNGLEGTGEAPQEAVVLREALAARGMGHRHARDLLTAFRMDVTKRRYRDWDDLIHYCSYSAMPVGRFMLDVHGESTATWAASDAVCAALQINNHLQDCAKDFAALDRVYIPEETLEKHGASIKDLGAAQASKQLRAALHELAARNEQLLEEGAALPNQVADLRFGCDVAVIQAFALRIVRMLKQRDPLSERVHLSKSQMALLALGAVGGELMRRAAGRGAVMRAAPRA